MAKRLIILLAARIEPQRCIFPPDVARQVAIVFKTHQSEALVRLLISSLAEQLDSAAMVDILASLLELVPLTPALATHAGNVMLRHYLRYVDHVVRN
jgi:hypothetical protein